MVGLLLRLCLLGQKILTLLKQLELMGQSKEVFCALSKVVKNGAHWVGSAFFLGWSFGKYSLFVLSKFGTIFIDNVSALVRSVLYVAL